MLSFIVTFLLMYGGMHVYAFFRLNQAITFSTPATAALAGWMLIMTCTPLLVRFFEGTDNAQAALLLAWPGYIWMGWIFIFCSLLLAFDILRYVLRFANHLYSFSLPTVLNSSVACEAVLLLSLVVSAYALYEARSITTEHVNITSTKLPLQSRPVRIVQISDVHVGLLFRESRLKGVLQAVRAARPDILVSTGDLVDGRLSKEDTLMQLNRMAEMISAIPTRCGKFAIFGNHEFYAGQGQAIEFTKKAGFTVLRNQSIQIPEGISITGLDDPARKRMGLPDSVTSEADLLRSAPLDHFRLLLKHRPTVDETSDGLFDLQLSGHVHQGQIFPFNLLVRLKFPIPCGTWETPRHSRIHVSRGTGTWGPPMRLLASPEVTIIDIKPAN